MEALHSRDVAMLSEAVDGVGGAAGLARLRAMIPPLVRLLVQCDVASYNGVGPPARLGGPREVHVEAEPSELLSDAALVESFAAHVHQNPLLAHFERTGQDATLRLSDHITRRALHRLELYDEVYRHLGVEHQLAASMRHGGGVVGITASRRSHDFDERERALLGALSPFVAAALANLRERSRLDALRGALAEARGPVAAILLVEGGGLAAADERSERWLSALAGGAPASLDRLVHWAVARGRLGAVAAASPYGVRRLAIAGVRGSPAVARYIAPAGARPAAVLVEAAPRVAGADDPRHGGRVAGLTARQAEVLALVARGATNNEVAAALAISPRTVAHHLEEIYRRLGVSTRTAAARRVTDLSSG